MSMQEWSEEAKEKYGNYAPRSVYDPNWIDPFTEPDLAQYWRNLREKFGRINFLGLSVIVDSKDLPLQSMWVSPALSEEKINVETDKEWEEKITDMWEVINYNPKLIILGDPGSGKSTIVQALCYLISLKEQPVSAPALQGMIPIPVILREEEFKTFTSVKEFWDSFLSLPFTHGLSRDRVEELGNLGQLFFIFDGIDELGSLARRLQVREVFWDLMDRFPSCRFVGTSRVAGYFEADFSFQTVVQDLKSSLEHRMHITLPGSEFIEKYGPGTSFADITGTDFKGGYKSVAQKHFVAPISNDRLSIFSSKWHKLRESSEEDAKAFVKSVKSKPSLDDLVRNPSFLLMALLVHFNAKTLPDGRAELYEKISEAYLERIESFKKISISESISINLRQKMRILSLIAYRMMLNRSPLDLRQPDPLKSNQTRANRSQLISWIKESVEDEGLEDCDPEKLLTFFSERAGLLLPSGSGDDELFEWPHLSFIEYFASVHLRENFSEFLMIDGPGEHPESLTRLHLQVMVDREPWRESLLFLAEQLDAKRTDQLLSCVVSDHFYAHVLLSSLLLNKVVSLSYSNRSRWFCTLANKGYKYSNLGIGSGWMQFKDNYGSEELVGHIVAMGIEGLISLDLSNKEVTDLAPLKNLKGLAELVLENVILTNAVPFLGFKDLKSLNFRGSPVKHLTILKGVKELNTLYLSNTEVTDLNFINECAGLRELYLWNTRVKDLAPLRKLNRLSLLHIGRTNVKDITPLKDLKNLTALAISLSDSKCLNLIGELTQLESLCFIDANSVDLTALKEVTALKTLEFIYTKVSDVFAFKELKGLTTLRLNGWDFHDVSSLEELKGLTNLDISVTYVEDITPLADLKALTNLNLHSTFVRDITPLKELKGLTTLNLSRTKVKDITPLAELKSLTTINLEGTNVKDLSPLRELWRLNSLRLRSTFLDLPGFENQTGMIEINGVRFVCGIKK